MTENTSLDALSLESGREENGEGPGECSITRRSDHREKLKLFRAELERENISCALIQTVTNFSWLTSGGRNFVALNRDLGVASLFIDQERFVLVTNNVEAERLVEEELFGIENVEVFSKPWYWDASADLNRLITLGRGQKPVRDDSEVLGPILHSLRQTLTPYEVDKYKELGNECGRILGQVARSTRRGMTEYEVAGNISSACLSKSIDIVVLMVGSDERLDTRRHPLPTNKVIKNKALLALCGRRDGLLVSLCRIIHFGPLPPGSSLQQRHNAVTYVDAVAIHNTRVGVTGSHIIEVMKEAYLAKGFEHEWQFHDQGGATGYKLREWRAEPGVNAEVKHPQAFTWNPSIAGTKSQDTILVTAPNAQPEVVTASPDWPMIRHEIDGSVILRPDILILE